MAIYIDKNVSFYKGITVTDDLIMNCIGVSEYSNLQYKYPKWFRFFRECSEIITPKEGRLPSCINLYISNDPYEIKKDLILHICGLDIQSNNIILCNGKDKPSFPLLEREESFYSWIFICIVMIILIILAIMTIFYIDSKEYRLQSFQKNK